MSRSTSPGARRSSSRDRILAGARADVTIITADAIDELEATGILTRDARADLVRSDISIAARPDEPVPDVSTVESLKAALVQCRAVAYSRRGASGVYFAGLLERLGIADQVNAQAVIVPQGLTGPRLSDPRGGSRGTANQRTDAGRGHQYLCHTSCRGSANHGVLNWHLQ